MSKLPQVKARDLIRVVEKLGFTFRDQSGSHAVYTHKMEEEQQFQFTLQTQSVQAY
jgi:predicted RNA binding protein YcfA (HicA-like mRNA interferase family)